MFNCICIYLIASYDVGQNAEAANNNIRPLGILINPLEGAIPKRIKTQATSKPATEILATDIDLNRPAIKTPTVFDSFNNQKKLNKRPLGILIFPDKNVKFDKKSTLPTQHNNTLNKQKTFKSLDTPAFPAIGRSAKRPLGLLIGPPISASNPRTLGLQKIYKNQIHSSKKLEFPKFSTSKKTSTEETASPIPVNFAADNLSYDQELGIISARGSVNLYYKDQRLNANVVSYNQKSGIVTASGNIFLQDTSGHRVYADYAQVTGDLKDGIIENIGILLKDHSRLAAARAKRIGGRILEMEKGVYSPCDLCPDKPSMPPIWQIKAVKITHNQDRKIIEYQDAWLEVSGLPVFYMPYFFHPDPTIKRKTGFLFPTFNSASKLGFIAKTPFFWVIDSHTDATISPILTTSEGGGLIGEYRERRKTGKIEGTASLILGDSQKAVRASIDASTKFNIDKNWRWGSQIQRSSDNSYLRRYKISLSDSYLTRYGDATSNSLVSNTYLEGFTTRNYFRASGYLFQDMRTGADTGESPIVLPLIDYNYVGDIDELGGYKTIDANMLNLHRDHGGDTQRFSLRPSWIKPFHGSMGDIYNFSIMMNSDFYFSQDHKHDDGSDFKQHEYRIRPQATLEWRLPLVLYGKKAIQILEPIVVALWSPNGGNLSNIPNEDSTEAEFDDTNLFSNNRFSGIDRIEGGGRLSYGIKWGIYNQMGGSASVLIGQSFRAREDSTFGTGSGLEENFSDIVSRVHISPGEHVDLFYRTRVAPDNLSPQRNELQLTAGIPAFRISTSYIFLDQMADSEFPGREELSGTISSQLTKTWHTNLNFRQDIQEKDLRSLGLGLKYEDECLVVRINGTRSFFEDTEVEPEDVITFNGVFKTLSERNIW